MTTPTTQPHIASRLWLRFLLAVTFLTRLPLPVRGEVSNDDLRASMGWYPLVGLALGAAGWGMCVGCARLHFSSLLTAVLVVLLLELFTGALHLDGFMDSCDGLGSGAPRERALEIMKDSRVGAMGVFGAIAVLLIKVAALESLVRGNAMWLPLLIGWMAARVVPVLDVALFPYARPAGTGHAFATGHGAWAPVSAVLQTLLLAWLLGRLPGLLFALAPLLTLLVQAGIARRLGGLTGDVYGMGIELTEALALMIGCILIQ